MGSVKRGGRFKTVVHVAFGVKNRAGNQRPEALPIAARKRFGSPLWIAKRKIQPHQNPPFRTPKGGGDDFHRRVPG